MIIKTYEYYSFVKFSCQWKIKRSYTFSEVFKIHKKYKNTIDI